MTLPIVLSLALSLFALTYAVHDPADNKCEDSFEQYICPPYTVEENDEVYDIRNYESSTWVETQMGTGGRSAAFWRLYVYINEATIAMTAPVLKRHTLLDDGTVSPEPEAMLFYSTNANPPEPEAGVTITRMSSFTAYVRSYAGRSNSTKVDDNVNKIMEELDPETQAKITGVYVAGYDAPFILFNRHNEVWLIE